MKHFFALMVAGMVLLPSAMALGAHCRAAACVEADCQIGSIHDTTRGSWGVPGVLAQEAEAEGDGEETPTRFYDFNEMLIDGEFMRPEGMFTRARDRARFQRLLDLRREFLDEIEESAKEEALH